MFFYRLLSTLALLVYSPYALLRSLTGRRRLGSIRGRLGREAYPDLAQGIWVHAVSVGEVGVARNLLAVLSRRVPERRLGLSVTTKAGRESARRAVPETVEVFSFPFDLAGPVERALSAVRPGLILLTETELWPLFLDRAKGRGIPVALVNGRISQRSLRRYRLAGRWFARVLENVALFLMQSEEDADRINQLGAPRERIRVAGNIKYDLPEAPAFADSAGLAEAAAGRQIFVAASTGEGEEKIVLEAWKELRPRPLLALAPRRPERFPEVGRLVKQQGLRLLRRSEAEEPRVAPSIQNPRSKIQNPPDVYLLDSVGELASLYREATLAFIGGSLIGVGGHNPIEAWAQGVPVFVGPHTESFREVTERGARLGFLQGVANAQELRESIATALADPAGMAARGERAKRFVAENRGAAAATADLVVPLLTSKTTRRAVAP